MWLAFMALNTCSMYTRQIKRKNKSLKIDPIVILIKEYSFSKLMNRSEIGADLTPDTALGKVTDVWAERTAD